MRSTPLFCQSDERDVHKEGEPWLLEVLQEEGSYKTPEMNLDDQGFMLPLDTSLVGEGGSLTANVPPYTRTVVPVLVEIIPAT